MKLFVGLGNPGEKYQNTRHNAGYIFVDKYAQKLDLNYETKGQSLLAKSGDLILAKPLTFMNNSGKSVAEIKDFFKIDTESIYIIHDDLDLRLGEYKIQHAVGPKVHNGIDSVEQKLGGKNFWRIRIGIDNRDPQNRAPGESYVLQSFESDERQILDNIIDQIIDSLI